MCVCLFFGLAFTICQGFCLALCFLPAPFFLFSFSFFFPPFLLSPVACGVLVPRLGVGSEPLRWEHWVYGAGMPENSQPQGTLIGESSSGGLHLNTKTQLHPTACRLQC